MSDNDVKILVDFHEPGMEQVGIFEDSVELSKRAIAHALQAIRWIADRTAEALGDIHHPPDQAEVEFGIKVEAEAGKLVASAAVEPHITVKLIWKKKVADDADHEFDEG